MKYLLASLHLFVLAAPALAHPGHVAHQDGHSHWIGLAALAAAAALVGLYKWIEASRRARRARHGRNG